jgi:hypothetical protein
VESSNLQGVTELCSIAQSSQSALKGRCSTTELRPSTESIQFYRARGEPATRDSAQTLPRIDSQNWFEARRDCARENQLAASPRPACVSPCFETVRARFRFQT